MPQVTGRAFVNVRGTRRNTEEGSTLHYSSLKRQGQIADTGVVGYAVSVDQPFIEGTIIHTKDVSLRELESITDESIAFETDTGKVFILTHAWCTGALEMSKGRLKVRFEGQTCEESGAV